jgi:transmembrane sensor
MKKNKIEKQLEKENDFHKIESVVAGMDKPELPDIDAEWNEFEKRIDQPEDIKVIPFFTKIRIIAASAACLVLMLTFAFCYLNFKETRYTTTSNKITITLKDGSEICMNKNSSIQYNAGYGIINRKIGLTGEAYFKVTKGHGSFIVNTSVAKIRVTGTQFNVKARKDKTEVGVSEGRVEFSSTTVRGSKIILTKGLYSSCVDNNLPTQAMAIQVPENSLWMSDRLMYRGSTVQEIIADIEELYNIKIEVSDPQILNLQVTGMINSKTPEDILQTLCTLIGKKFRLDHHQYVVY